MDANNNIIPYVEDDQGEGVKDPLEIDDIMRELRKTQIKYSNEILKHITKHHQFIPETEFKRMQKK